MGTQKLSYNLVDELLPRRTNVGIEISAVEYYATFVTTQNEMTVVIIMSVFIKEGEK
jgi:hypothetical protein